MDDSKIITCSFMHDNFHVEDENRNGGCTKNTIGHGFGLDAFPVPFLLHPSFCMVQPVEEKPWHVLRELRVPALYHRQAPKQTGYDFDDLPPPSYRIAETGNLKEMAEERRKRYEAEETRNKTGKENTETKSLTIIFGASSTSLAPTSASSSSSSFPITYASLGLGTPAWKKRKPLQQLTGINGKKVSGKMNDRRPPPLTFDEGMPPSQNVLAEINERKMLEIEKWNQRQRLRDLVYQETKVEKETKKMQVHVEQKRIQKRVQKLISANGNQNKIETKNNDDDDDETEALGKSNDIWASALFEKLENA